MSESHEVRHSYKDALGERDYEHLLEGAVLLDEKYRLETRFIIFLAGRLGLRAGEICHMDESWVDYDREMIQIPEYESCECGYCKEQTRQEVEWTGVDFDDALNRRWKPKTPKAARPVPYGFSARTEIIIERFFDRFDEFPYSRKTVNRRVKRAAENAIRVDPETTYPHALRSTAATHHAARGLKPMNLQLLMGWSDISTSEKYVGLTGEHLDRALKQIHNR